MGKLIINIKSKYGEMTSKEKPIADFLLNKGSGLILTISELSEKTGSSEATIVRFAKKLGYRGYPELKIAMANEDYHGFGLNMSEQDNITSLFAKVSDDVQATFKKTKEVLDGTALLKASDAILNAREIYLFGVGSSANIANDAAHKFFRIGLPVHSFSDSHMQLMAAVNASDKDVVIAISHSGKTKDIIDACEIAKENNATVIAITSEQKSPIHEIADILLLTSSDEINYRYLGLTSRYAQLAIIDTIYSNIVIHNKERNDFSQNIEERVLSKRVEYKSLKKKIKSSVK